MHRTRREWILDLSGLLVQGVGVPVLQFTVVVAALVALTPGWRGGVPLGVIGGLLVNFVLVDYAYYWNHRLLHAGWLWRWHAVHHTAPALDVLVTARNTVWTPALILYLWVNGLALFLLEDPRGFVFAAGLTCLLDVWRHSPWAPPRGSRRGRVLGWILITPHEHGWHHSTARPGCNFGANLSWWDRLHGTYWCPPSPPQSLGIPRRDSTARMLLWPRTGSA
ncbi:MAG TPA: sterol desaturase family protein [Candidatus Acidoferrum sp.]|nr:sterol desaturase family protein [Candidatus Acidoferrum sp.]